MSVSEERAKSHQKRVSHRDELRKKVLNLKNNHGCSNLEIAQGLRIRESQVRAILQEVRNG